MNFQEVVHSIKTGEADCDEQSVSEERDRMDYHHTPASDPGASTMNDGVEKLALLYVHDPDKV